MRSPTQASTSGLEHLSPPVLLPPLWPELLGNSNQEKQTPFLHSSSSVHPGKSGIPQVLPQAMNSLATQPQWMTSSTPWLLPNLMWTECSALSSLKLTFTLLPQTDLQKALSIPAGWRMCSPVLQCPESGHSVIPCPSSHHPSALFSVNPAH